MFFYDFLSSILVTAVAVVVIVMSGRMPPPLAGSMGPGFWPGFLGYVLLVLGVVLFVQTLIKRHLELRRRKNSGRDEPPPAPPIQFSSRGMRGVYVLFAIFAVFVAVLAKASFLAATVVFVPGVMRLLGEKRPAVIAAMTVGAPIAVYIIFVRILGIALP